MLTHGDAKVQVPRFSAARPWTTLAGQAHAGSRLHAGRDLDLEAGRFRDRPFAAAARAGLADGPLSLAARAGGAEHAAHADLARASALRAGLRLASRAGAASLASLKPARNAE